MSSARFIHACMHACMHSFIHFLTTNQGKHFLTKMQRRKSESKNTNNDYNDSLHAFLYHIIYYSTNCNTVQISYCSQYLSPYVGYILQYIYNPGQKSLGHCTFKQGNAITLERETLGRRFYAPPPHLPQPMLKSTGSILA